VVIDPGHGADEVGAAAGGVVEKTSNLELAFRVEALLQAQGVRVQLTRRADERAYSGPQDGGFNSTRRDLQARVDLANDAGADLFVSIHSNGSASSADRGIETYYNSQRPFAEQNRALAASLQAALVSEMSAAGYLVSDRGYKDDACLRAFQGRCFPLFVLGPPRITTRDEVLRRGGDPSTFGFATGADAVGSRATLMPGALVELLFISNPVDNALLSSEEARAALARGVTRGILEFLAAGLRAG
jgi:N-acetylmuramoyl-L-alanine amidase